MSHSVFVLRVVNGEIAPLDAERSRRVTQPYAVDGGADEDFSLRGR
ncbi:hypothetical protein [Streptomyces sp. NPDC057382]